MLGTSTELEVLHTRAVLFTVVSSAFSPPESEKFQLLRRTQFQKQSASAAAYEYVTLYGHTLSKKASYELEQQRGQEVFYKT